MSPNMKTLGMAMVTFLILCSRSFYPSAFAASGSPDLLKIKQESESKGYVFLTNRDEIVSKAKKEGKLHTALALEGSLKITAEAFKKRGSSPYRVGKSSMKTELFTRENRRFQG